MRAGRVCLAVVAALAIAGCGGSKETLTLRAEGTSATIDVEYQVGDEEPVSESVQSPWRLDVDVDGDWSVDLVVENTSTTGTVTCFLEGDAVNRPVGTNGEASAHCSATKSGDTTQYETEGEEFSSAAVRGTGPAAPGPIERLPIDISSAKRFTYHDGDLYITNGDEVLDYATKDGDTTELSVPAADPSEPPDIDAVAVGVDTYALDIGPGALYRLVANTFESLTTVVGAADVVRVGSEYWVPAVGDGAANKPGIVRFDGAGKRLGVIPGYTDVLAVGPDSVVAYRGDEFALLGLDGSVKSTGSPAFPSANLSGAFVGDDAVVGSREDGRLYLLDPQTWTATPVSEEYELVFSDGVGGAWVSDLDGRVAPFDRAAGKPGPGITPVEGGHVVAASGDTLWIGTTDGSLFAVDRSVFR
jgi:PQQ-like domain